MLPKCENLHLRVRASLPVPQGNQFLLPSVSSNDPRRLMSLIRCRLRLFFSQSQHHNKSHVGSSFHNPLSPLRDGSAVLKLSREGVDFTHVSPVLLDFWGNRRGHRLFQRLSGVSWCGRKTSCPAVQEIRINSSEFSEFCCVSVV